jgi:uncharacterized spore protein YtfJ
MKESSLNSAELSALVDKSSAAAVEPVERTLERFLDIASVKSVYDKPVQHGETMIIPAAEVLGGLGFGMGAGLGVGENPAKKEKVEGGEGVEEEKPVESPESGTGIKVEGAGGGGGGGGGGRVFARPVAVIVSGPDGVIVQPVVDATKIALAFFTALGFMVGMASRMRRPPRSLE